MAFKIPEEKNPVDPTSTEQIALWAAEKAKLLDLGVGSEIDRLISEKVFGNEPLIWRSCWERKRSAIGP